MVTNLTQLYEKLPEHRTLIARRYQVDPSFREMCEDFCHVYGMLTTIRHVNNTSDTKTSEVWEELLWEIECEILAVLHTHTGPSAMWDNCVDRATDDKPTAPVGKDEYGGDEDLPGKKVICQPSAAPL